MKYNRIIATLFFVSIASGVMSQSRILKGESADKKIKNSKELYYQNEKQVVPNYIKLDEEHAIQPINFTEWFRSTISKDTKYDFELVSTISDNIGQQHHKFRQLFQGVPVEEGVYILHGKDNKVATMNGHIAQNIPDVNPSLPERAAFKIALAYIDAKVYRWEIKHEDEHLKKETGNPNATYAPTGQLIIIRLENTQKYRLAYKFDIYALKPLKRANVYVDAQSGEILREDNRICQIGGVPHIHDESIEEHHHVHHNNIDATGTAQTRYSGSRSITTDSFTGGFRLRESGRGNGIETYNMQQGTTYSNAIDFSNTTNSWSRTANFENAAYDAHWGAEVTYDFFMNKFGRSSYDGNGAKMLSYVHYSTNYDNAFWDGYRMTYGNGSNSSGGFTPLTSLDVVGHEFTHGLTEYTAGLIYSGESGALNESFSDIFGTAIEFYGKPGQANYLIGDEIVFGGGSLRSMSNPKLHNNPNTYQGTYWSTSSNAVHTNSGVGNYWFYLLSMGGTGTNDKGNNYSVSGIGLEKATAIAYRNLTVYLTPGSNYADARYYSIRSAIDLYGACSPEVEAVTNAWHAVGVGMSFVPEVVADFTVPDTLYCSAPATVGFMNRTMNGNTFAWTFGDGQSSTEENPTHVYQNFGVYTVSLSSNGGACGTGSVTKTAYIVVDPEARCITRLPATGAGTVQTACTGSIYDNGGTDQNYSDNTNGWVTISVQGASAIRLTFNSFNFENSWDYLYVYNGTSINSPLIGQYTGQNLPNGGVVVSSGSSITIQQITDGSVSFSGFEAEWNCILPNSPPVIEFTATPLVSCDGAITFQDMSVNAPTSWSWDFGDGTSSTQQNPTKNYTSSDVYDVSLTACNSFGCNTMTKNTYVNVNLQGECAFTLPTTGQETSNDCNGRVQDSGGDNLYTNNTNGTFTISPLGAQAIVLEFNSFSFESGFDYLFIFDGATTSSPLIGQYTGNTLPEGGIVSSSGGSITLQQLTDGSVVDQGFEASWSCISQNSPPNAAFSAVNTTSCDGVIVFQDASVNNPTSWSWDFGDGTNSTEQSPVKTYTSNGVYTVSLTVCNANGCNTRVREDYINVSLSGGCAINMPLTGNVISRSCTGILKDNGGDGDYSNYVDGSVTISPVGAQIIELTFSSFRLESGFDYVYIYDGPSTSSPLIKTYTGYNLPENGDVISSTGSSITIRQTTDGSVVDSGFELSWLCVGDISPVASFSALNTSSCDGQISFRDSSLFIPTSWSWDFGDGTTSIEQNPTKTYTSNGTYSVSLTACNAFGCNTTTREDYIIISNLGNCAVNIPTSGNQSTQACFGTLRDSGGEGNYSNNTNGSVTIQPVNARNVTLNFNLFSFESGYDYLYVYDGASINSPLIGRYSGASMPSNGTITSTGGAITIRQTTDNSIVYSGFELTWSCLTISSPTSMFSGFSTKSCNGIVRFVDESINFPTSWSWSFGDGSTSTEQNPVKTYTQDGFYTVSLTSCNEIGCNTLIKEQYITVELSDECGANMPTTGNVVLTSCVGLIKDNGGDNNYTNNVDGSITIAPTGANSVILNFGLFELESSFDYVYIYDGPSTSSPLIARYTGTSLPNNGASIVSTGGSITIRQTTDGSVVYRGFECYWECEFLTSLDKDFTKEITDLIVYPNPAKDYSLIQWDFAGEKQLNITIMNAFHATIYEEQGVFNNGYKKEIATDLLSAGFYYITVYDGTNMLTAKLVVQ